MLYVSFFDTLQAFLSGIYAVKLLNFKRTSLNYRRLLRENADAKALLGANVQLKDKHKGKRCFILGNGPSLKQEDLSALKDEIVFTVNQASRMPQFDAIRSDYHFWADPSFFQIDDSKAEYQDLLNTMHAVGRGNPQLQCFFPIQFQWFVQKYHLEQDLNVRYFYYYGMLLYDGWNGKIDYTGPVPCFSTVVQFCITMAIYMGFSEIYLLGCDNTSILVNIKSMLRQNDDRDYAYAVSENEKKRMESLLGDGGLEGYLSSYLATFRDYRRLYQYCADRGIQLVNCSAETVIDSIPRKRLKDVLNP